MYKSPNMTPAIKRRVAVEARIVRATVRSLLAAGYSLGVFDGEERHPASNDQTKLYKNLMETDEDYLFVYTADPANTEELENGWFGWVRFVYGNDDGNTVICDYTVNLEDVLAPVNTMAETLA